MANTEYMFYSLEFLKTSERGSGFYDAPDTDMDVEKIVLHRMIMERLLKILSRIPQSEREFILDCFDAEWGARKEIAEKYKLTVEAVKHKKKRIMKKIKKMFFEDMDFMPDDL